MPLTPSNIVLNKRNARKCIELFSFASRTIENIRRGVEAKRWAVATVSQSAMRGRMTKARKYLHVGDRGLLYNNPTHSFTTPFIVTSTADPYEVENDVWPEPWALPFSISPLGGPHKQLPNEVAVNRWPFLRHLMRDRGGVPAAMNLTGTTVFVPIEISEADWELILGDLADPQSR